MRPTTSNLALATVVLAVATLCSAHTGAPVATQMPRQAPAAVALDCNGNGIEDALDIAGGYSADHDCDGVPDECALGR
jgi:hypothetical protein